MFDTCRNKEVGHGVQSGDRSGCELQRALSNQRRGQVSSAGCYRNYGRQTGYFVIGAATKAQGGRIETPAVAANVHCAEPVANLLNQLRHCSKPIVRLSLISIPAPTSTEHTLFTRQHTAYLPALKLRYVRPSLTSVCLEGGKRTLEKRTWSRAVVPSLSGKPRLHGDVTHRREARPAPSRPQTLLVLSFMVLLHCNNILNAYNLTILLGSYFGRLTGPVPRRYEGNRSMDPPGVCELGSGL